MTLIGNGMALYDNGAGIRGIIDMTAATKADNEAIEYTINVVADAAGHAKNVRGATQVAQSNDWANDGSRFALSLAVGTLVGGPLGLAVGYGFEKVAFKDEDGNGLGLLEKNPNANLNYAHEFDIVGSPYYQSSNLITDSTTYSSNEGRNYPKPSSSLTPSAPSAGSVTSPTEVRSTSASGSQAARANAMVQSHVYDLSNLAALGRAVESGNTMNVAEAAAAKSKAQEEARLAADKAFEDDWTAAQNAHNNIGSPSADQFDVEWNAAQNEYKGSSDQFPSNVDSDESFEADWSAATGGFFPIVIDLDGDGVALRPLSSSATFFDTDSDHYHERTAWAGADDGILVIDLDGDGQVTQAKEIAFAEWTEEQDSDLQALGKVFDSQDERFGEFRIWKDANNNCVVANHDCIYLVA